MEQLQRALEPYRHLDPTGWVGAFRFLPAWAGLVVAAVGVAVLLFGGRRLFRLVAAPLGAVLAQVFAADLARRLGVGPQQVGQVVPAATVVLFGLGLISPAAVTFFAVGIPAGLLGGQLAGANDWLLGFGPGFFLGGVGGLLLHQWAAPVVSAAAGGWLVVLGLMAALRPLVGQVNWLADRPVVAMSLAGCLAVGGAVFQLFVRRSEEEARDEASRKAQRKQRDKEEKAAMARFEKYRRG